ncbi:MAG: PilZ domain-containing protein [Sphingomonadaceae bacterium]
MVAQPSFTDERSSERRWVRVRALIREAGSQRLDIDLVDLSINGFRFESLYAFAPGARVFISFPGLAPLEATIAWRNRDQYGCRLTHALHPAIFDNLAHRFRS